MYFNLKHLKEAKIKAGKPNAGYWWHFRLAMNEAFFLLAVTIGSVIHAVFPWVLDFKLLEWRINRLKVLKEMLPDDPQLKKVHFDEL
jgi:hypothetical protein|tara:strand:+ start:5415 stop:5675 length:261 start_codon:yes stop_codon:yes gene_type:complete